MKKITIGFYDEKQFVKSFVSDSIRRIKSYEVLFSASNESEIFTCLNVIVPNILILNLLSKKQFHCALIRKIKNNFPRLKLIGFVYGNELSQQEVFSIINAGACSILTDNHSPDDIVKSVEEVVQKGFLLNEVVTEAMFSFLKRNNTLRRSFGTEEKFSEREIKILEGKKSGKTSFQMADELCVSKKTVDGVLHDMYVRFGCNNIHELLSKYDYKLIA